MISWRCVVATVCAACALACESGSAPGDSVTNAHDEPGAADSKVLASEKLVIEAPSSLQARVGRELEQPLRVRGGSGPYRWSLIGQPPAWLELAPDGDAGATLTAIPEHSGHFTVRVRVESADGLDAAIERELRVAPKRWVAYTSTETDGEPYDSGSVVVAELDPGAVAPAAPRALKFLASGVPVWSGDGSWLVAFSLADSLRVADLGGAELGTVDELAFAGEAALAVHAAPAGTHFLIETMDTPPQCNPRCALRYHLYDFDPSLSSGAQLTKLEDGMTQLATLAWSPDGSRVLFRTTETSPDGVGDAPLMLFDLGARSGAGVRVDFRGVLLEQETWSPDGRWIALATYGAADQLHLLNMAAQQPSTAAAATVIAGGLDAWSPDGAQLVTWGASAQSSAYQARVVNVSGQTPSVSAPLALPFATSRNTFDFLPARWSADGKRFALTLGPAPIELVVFDSASSESGPIGRRTLADTEIPFVTWTAAGSLLFRQGQELFLQGFEGGGEPQAIAHDAGPDPEHGADILLSPDHRALAYRPSSGDGRLQLIAPDSGLEQRVVPFAGKPVQSFSGSAAWLSDGSALVAITRDSDEAEDPSAPCAQGCRLEYAFVSPDGVLERSGIGQGRVLAPYLSLQP